MRPRILIRPPRAPLKAALALPDVTLVAVTSVAVPQTVRAMALSLEQVRFGAAILLSDHTPVDASCGVRWERIAPIRSRAAYSHFMLHDLRRHIATSHLLCVQWDGYVLDAHGWDPAFLDYDYIGAPWPHFGDGHDVGNGGFSLRSARLLDACIALGIDDVPEDVAICRTHRAALEREHGIRFAPVDVARAFAFERHAPNGREFGFHGVFNLVSRVDGRTSVELLEGLEAGVLNRREHRELMRFAIGNGRLGLARTLVRRMRHRDARRH